jgi:heptosyltransferase-3
MKILLIKFLHIGDVLLMTPLIKNLKLHYSNISIDVAVNKGTEDMLSLNPLIDHIHLYDREEIRKGSFFKRLQNEFSYAHKIRNKKYDIVINTTKGDRGLLLAIFSGAKEIIGHKSDKFFILNSFINRVLPSVKAKHAIDINLDVLRTFGKEPQEKRVELFWNSNTDEKISTLLKDMNLENKKFIHFHPVSRWFFKCIDDVIAAKIVDFCQDKLEITIVITAAPVEEEIKKIDKIISYCKTKPINLTGKLSLKETAALNKRSCLYVGVDTAIMHISAANNVPTLAFFGPSLPYVWGPWDNKYLENGYKEIKGNQKMGKHRILQKSWDCVPCDDKGCNKTHISDCLIQMDMREIERNIVEMLKVDK